MNASGRGSRCRSIRSDVETGTCERRPETPYTSVPITKGSRKPTPLPTKGDLAALSPGELRVFVDIVLAVLGEALVETAEGAS